MISVRLLAGELARGQAEGMENQIAATATVTWNEAAWFQQWLAMASSERA